MKTYKYRENLSYIDLMAENKGEVKKLKIEKLLTEKI